MISSTHVKMLTTLQHLVAAAPGGFPRARPPPTPPAGKMFRTDSPPPRPRSWRLGFAQQSAIDQLLEGDSFTLTQLLDEDDLLQECKQLNKKLVEL